MDGDDKYDFVLDRIPGEIETNEESNTEDTGVLSTLVEAYSSEGEFKWRVKMGNNVQTSAGAGDIVSIH
ncbi:MAG: hypothetical protein ACLT4H_00055 [Bacteroides thetaiotaomicron]|uniref:rhamnogalacturonan lyase family protein n=1 Tax=Bacteroides thetaiotaomicron TaxID=818 RepID=UPI00039A03B0|nr:hypothetical protein [Bacteroides thetaiotaomicron]